MDAVNKTLYIPLYGKAYVSGRGLFLHDPDAERIWKAEGFPLGKKSKSKYLSFYMGIRAAVFDDWARARMAEADPASTVLLHIGCGLDSRFKRVGCGAFTWYDMDFPQVIRERKRHFASTKTYRMISGDARETSWLAQIPEGKDAIVIMEGISMYLTVEENRALQSALCAHFGKVALLTDCYSVLAAKMSRYKNPVNEVGVQTVWGIDDPTLIEGEEMRFTREHNMMPQAFLSQLKGMEGMIFRHLYAGKLAGGLYRMLEYRKTKEY